MWAKPAAPGCTVPGHYSQVHHVTDHAQRGHTDINNPTFACGTQHHILKPNGRTTRKNPNGDTEWIPPPHLDHDQPRTNTYWHPKNSSTTKTTTTTRSSADAPLASV
ncbi:hypothetical protein [Mycobacterium palustre]|uniref:HNH domain-containing protein n=1 Tax=Mycobacterium palustre TaxID=153971 RepID=A0A1X1ZQJ9_9MYCO|nr:hypothetical protein [Mycobacterium palustre]ORW25669.1 hypothetical protein AWC19_06495 [Mycobacterium palustre]